MSARFFQTIMGRGFFEHQLPELIKQLQCISHELRRYNDRQEREDWERRHAKKKDLQKLNEANSNTESELSGDTDE